jgi:predicted double-glycine peptidase
MVRQEHELSCGPACVRQILLDNGVEEAESTIRELCGFDPERGSWEDGLAAALQEMSGQNYGRGQVGPDDWSYLFRRVPFIAMLKPRTGLHWVIVDEVAEDVVHIRDPWGIPEEDNMHGFEGIMKRGEFDNLWRLSYNRAVYRNPAK